MNKKPLNIFLLHHKTLGACPLTKAIERYLVNSLLKYMLEQDNERDNTIILIISTKTYK